jgi:hypothetical protein
MNFVTPTLRRRSSVARVHKHLCKASSQRLESSYGFTSPRIEGTFADRQKTANLLDSCNGVPGWILRVPPMLCS